MPKVALMRFQTDNYDMKLLLRSGLSILILVLSLRKGFAVALESGMLAEAASRGDVSEVKALLGMGVHPDEPDGEGQTALGFATLLGHIELIDILCEAGADPNLVGPKGLNPLMTAVQASNYGLVVVLLNYGANANFVSDLAGTERIPISVLSLAINRRDYEVVRLLISEGAKASRLTDFETSNPLNLPGVEIPLDYRIWRYLFALRDFANSPDWDAAADVGNDEWILHRAVRDHDFELLERSIREGKSPNRLNAKKVSPLMVAAWHGNQGAVTLLLDRGANLADRDVMGRDALCYAVAGGDIAIVRRLLVGLGRDAADIASEFDAPADLPAEEDFAAELELLLERDGMPLKNAPLSDTALMSEPEAAGESREIEETTPAEPGSRENDSQNTEDIHGLGSFEASPLYYALATGNRLVLDMLLSADFATPIEDEEGVDPLMMAAWLADLYSVKKLVSYYSSRRNDLAGRTALAWSTAAFARDRTLARDSGYSNLPSRNYPVARFLCARQRSPQMYNPEPSTEIPSSVIEAWNPGGSFDDVDYWRQLEPSPVPPIPGDGDRTLYQILRDEEHDIDENVTP